VKFIENIENKSRIKHNYQQTVLTTVLYSAKWREAYYRFYIYLS